MIMLREERAHPSCSRRAIASRFMTDDLNESLAAYDRAVRLASETYRGMSADERWARSTAAPQLAEHAPSNRTNPTCPGCDGAQWPCSTALGAVIMAGPHYN